MDADGTMKSAVVPQSTVTATYKNELARTYEQGQRRYYFIR